jgi:hypothetical protein
VIRKSKVNSSQKEIFQVPDEAGEVASQIRDDRLNTPVENQTIEVLGVCHARPFDLEMSPIGEIGTNKADDNILLMASENKDVVSDGEQNSLGEISLPDDAALRPANLSLEPALIAEGGNINLPLDRPENSLERLNLNLHRNASEPVLLSLQNSQPKTRTAKSKKSETPEVIPDAEPQTQTKAKPSRPEDFARAQTYDQSLIP